MFSTALTHAPEYMHTHLILGKSAFREYGEIGCEMLSACPELGNLIKSLANSNGRNSSESPVHAFSPP